MGATADVRLIDQHCHALCLDPLDEPAFAALCTESPFAAGRGSHLDGPVGMAIGRWCPPLVGLPAWVAWPTYLERRHAVGGAEVARLMLGSTRTERLLVDTGYRGDELCDLDGMASLAECAVGEIVRIEPLVEQLAKECSAATLIRTFEAALVRAATTCAGFKTVLAYRCGFDLDLVRAAPTLSQIDGWLRRGGRMDDPVIIAKLVRVAAKVAGQFGKPLQFHVGYGDPDVTLHRTNPSLLTPFIEWAMPLKTPIVLLHCWPYQREAGYLATVYPHVWADCGLTLHYSGPSAVETLSAFFEMTPHTKVMYSSDAFGLAELYAAGAAQFRWALDVLLDRWLAAGSINAVTAERIACNVGSDNARACYALTV